MAYFGMDPFSAGPLWHNGPTPGGIYNFPGRQVESSGRFIERSKYVFTMGILTCHPLSIYHFCFGMNPIFRCYCFLNF